jgi:site-specific recombinase XerD
VFVFGGWGAGEGGLFPLPLPSNVLDFAFFSAISHSETESSDTLGMSRSDRLLLGANMHVIFEDDGRPFLLDSDMRWELEPNAFLTRVSTVSGRTSSPRTWRSYAYQLADWLSFCCETEVGWRFVTELNIATYRNILASEMSPQTGRPLKRSTINHKLSVVCQFYEFVYKKGWMTALPFESGATRVSYRQFNELRPRAMLNAGRTPGSDLRLRQTMVEPHIPSRQDLRQFIKSFCTWRDRLIAELFWFTGMRSAEVCALPLRALPDDPASIDRDAVSIKILGKGQKWRLVLFPVRLLRSIARYIHMERRQCARSAMNSGTVFLGRQGKPLQTPAINRVFSTNCKRTGMHIWPHLLRHAYAVERLAYLQDIGAPNPLKTLQMELGHASMATTEQYLHVTERMRGTLTTEHNSFVDRLLEG